MPNAKNIKYHHCEIMLCLSFAFSGFCSKVAKARKSKGKVCTLSLLRLAAADHAFDKAESQNSQIHAHQTGGDGTDAGNDR